MRLVSEGLSVREPIIEFGARQVDGQADFADLRQFFGGKQYIGCDYVAGPGVDRIENIMNLTIQNDSAGTCILVDTLEHVADPFKAMSEIWRILRPGGIVLLTVPFAFEIHSFPYDYFRYTKEGVASLLGRFGARIIGQHGNSKNPHTIYAVAAKGQSVKLEFLAKYLNHNSDKIGLYQAGRLGTLISRFYSLRFRAWQTLSEVMQRDKIEFISKGE